MLKPRTGQRGTASVAVWKGSSESVPVLLDEVNETICGRVVGGDGCVALEFRLNLLGQLFPELHPIQEKVLGSEYNQVSS